LQPGHLTLINQHTEIALVKPMIIPKKRVMIRVVMLVKFIAPLCLPIVAGALSR